MSLGRKRDFHRPGPYGREAKNEFDLRSCLHARLRTLGLKPILYAGLENGTVRNFGEYQLSERAIKVGCDYLTEEMRKASPSRLVIIRICAEEVYSWWRRKAPNRELLGDLKQRLDAIIHEANDKLKPYVNGH